MSEVVITSQRSFARCRLSAQHRREIVVRVSANRRNLSSKHSLVAVWTIILALLFQQSALARISIRPSARPSGLQTAGRQNGGELSQAGRILFDSNSGTRIVRVTDSRDGQVSLAAGVDASSFNRDGTRFIVIVDGIPTLYSMDPSSLEIRKQGQLRGLNRAQVDSLRWSAREPETIIGLESDSSVQIIAYDTNSGSTTVLKDFSNSLGAGVAGQLSKSWFDDNHFAFTWREGGSSFRLVVVWDRTADTTFVFYLDDPVCGVTGFTKAYLDKAGEALIVEGDATRVWRYRTAAQSESIQLETGVTSREMTAESQQNESPDLLSLIDHPDRLPGGGLSRDGRFSIFSSRTEGSRSDVFIAAVYANVAAANVTWTNMVNCSAAGNSLQKTGGDDMADDAHATSALAALSGDVYVEFTAQQTNKERWCGLNNTNEIHQSAGDIDYAIKLGANKKASVVENGVVKAKIKYKPGSVLRVAVESGVVNYYKNGTVFYTSTALPVYPLLVDASLLNTMAAVDNVMISVMQAGTVLSISPAKASLVGGATLQFSALVTGGSDTIVWSATGGSITPSGLYTAPLVFGTYTVRSALSSNPNIFASATVIVTSGVDVTPPVISAVSATNISAMGVTITWNTDEPSDTQVEYGTSTSYGSFSTKNPALVTSHGVVFGGLSPATLYHYRVRSKDAAGNQAVSGDFSFTTLGGGGGGDTTPPVVSGVSTSGITPSSAMINWTTNEVSDSQVDYGTTSGYGSSTGLNAVMVTTHSAFISGLTASTAYHYRAKSRDAAGNLGVSGDFTFTTSTPPPDPGGSVITDHNVYPEPAPPALPAAGGTFVDPVFGTTIMRVTDERDGQSNFNYYSYWPTFNLNDTKFFIACDNTPKLYQFDPNGFRIISKGPLYDQTLPGGGFMSTEDAEWSGINSNILYGYYGLKLWAFDVSARTYTLIKDFTGLVPNGYLGQMSRSLDDNVFAFTLKDPNYAPTGYVVWQRDQNRIVRQVSLSNFDEVELDKTGRFLVVKALFGGGVDFQVVDFQTGSVTGLTDGAPDYSPGHSDNGHNIVVGYDDWNNQYTVRNLAAPHQFQRVISFGNDWSQANHVSMLGDNEGWCLISNFTNGTAPVGPFRQEIFQASTDGTQSVRRLAHHHSVYRDYWDTPRGDISRDGRFVAFTSNWGSATRRDVFIIKVPQSSGGGDTTPPVITGVNASSITATGATVSWSTNEASDTQVEYGTSAAYGSATPLNTSMTASHSAAMSVLLANTLYHYRVRSRDAAGNLAVSGDFTLTTSASGGGGGGSTQNVVWINSVNCTATGNSLQKTSGLGDTPDAAGASQQQLASGDGYFEFTAGSTGKIRFCGLSHSSVGTDFEAIDFAIKLTELGVAEIRENNAYQGETTYTSTDVFRIAIQGGVVKYYKNGLVFNTSGRAPTYPLRVYAVFIQLNGTVNNAVISAGSGGVLALSLKSARPAYLTFGQLFGWVTGELLFEPMRDVKNRGSRFSQLQFFNGRRCVYS